MGLNIRAKRGLSPKEKPPPMAGAGRGEECQPELQRFFTRPSAFLMFCTLGIEIPTVAAISFPVLPASTSFFTWARVSSVMMARVRRRRRPLAALGPEAPAFDFARRP